MCIILRTSLATSGENTCTPGGSVFVLFSRPTGMTSPLCAKAVYACAIWNSEADRP
jgi:hypothetical protein